MYYLKKDSADGRVLIWKISLQMMARHPLGVGIGNFSGSYGEEQAAYFTSDHATEQEQNVAGYPEYGFNEYLQIGVEQGIISLMLWLSMMGYSLYMGIRRRRIASTASLVALLIASFASYPFSVLPFLIVMIFLLADIHHSKIQECLLQAKRKSRNSKTDESKIQDCSTIFRFMNSRIRRWEQWMVMLLGLCIIVGCLYNRYPTYQAYREWNRAKLLYHENAFETAIEAYTPLYPLLSDRVSFLFEYGRNLSQTGHYVKSNAMLQKAMRMSCDPMLYNVMGKNWQALKMYSQAESCLLKSVQTVPGRLYPWYLLARLYEEMGLHDKACEMATIVLAKEPKIQSTAVQEMRKEMQMIIYTEKSDE
jgi:tetratricopeptide (TPR) repeat protein